MGAPSRGATDHACAWHRPQQYRQSVAAADALRPPLNDRRAFQMYGMLHLNAALACAAQRRADDTMTHLNEAAALADRLDDEVGAFANLWFGRANVGIWRVSLATELGEGGRVAELARDVHPEVLPVQRQSMYWADLGRGLVTERRTRDQGMQALIHAEQLAPQQVRNNLFVRETVAGLLRQARRDAGGRELRGLAWRMGVAPGRVNLVRVRAQFHPGRCTRASTRGSAACWRCRDVTAAAPRRPPRLVDVAATAAALAGAEFTDLPGEPLLAR